MDSLILGGFSTHLLFLSPSLTLTTVTLVWAEFSLFCYRPHTLSPTLRSHEIGRQSWVSGEFVLLELTGLCMTLNKSGCKAQITISQVNLHQVQQINMATHISYLGVA